MVLAATLAAAGCATSQSGSRTASGIPLTQRVLASTKLPRMHATAIVRPIPSARQWLADRGVTGAELPRRTKLLRRLGFIAGARETLVSQRRNVAAVTSIVEELGGPGAASHALADEYRRARAAAARPGVTLRSFAVSSIPRAIGYEVTRKSTDTRVVGFFDGPFCYLQTSVAPVGERHAPTRTELIAAAESLYQRVRDRR